ncbi:MAG: histidinol-phosphate transaminase [Aquificae bacterium]|nr:histidinol-phosphate transaminase [Aquificota bacterium]
MFERLKKLKPYKTETTPCKIKLSSNEDPFELPLWLREKIATAIKKIPFQRYPDPTSTKLKKQLAKFYKVNPENIVLGNGSDELIHLLITIAGDYSRPVMYPIPTFPMYQVSADIVGRAKIEIPLDHNFQLKKDQIDKALDKNPSIAFFATPNNPTGNSLDRELILYTASKGVLTVVDEAYIHFSQREDFLNEALTKDNIIVLRTLSKIGLAGIRLGALIAKKEIAQEIDKARAPFNITYPTQVIGEIVLSQGIKEIEKHIKIIILERDKLIKKLSSFKKIKVYPSDANFFLIKVPNGNLLHKKLIEKGILVRNMSHLPNLENCLRVSIGKPEENSAFFRAFKQIIQELDWT